MAEEQNDSVDARRNPPLLLPTFDSRLLSENWPNNRTHSAKLQIAALSIRCTLSAMCGMHVHTLSGKKKQDLWQICSVKYRELVSALQHKYPRASVGEYLPYVALTKLVPMTGEKVFRMAQAVRKECRNAYNPLWNSGLVNGSPPSGKDWTWVRDRVLVLLYRKKKKDETSLRPNDGSLCVVYMCVRSLFILFVVDLNMELISIREDCPFWGRGQPREWHCFMSFGLGRKCSDGNAEADIWTLTAPARNHSRKRSGRLNQRAVSQTKRQRLRDAADARYRDATRSVDAMSVMHQQLVMSFNNFNVAFLRKQRVAELSQLAQLGVPTAMQELRLLLQTPLRLTSVSTSPDDVRVTGPTSPDDVGSTGPDTPFDDGDADADSTDDVVPAPVPTDDVAPDPLPTDDVVPDPLPTDDVVPVTTVPDPAPAAPAPNRRSLGTRRRRHKDYRAMHIGV